MTSQGTKVPSSRVSISAEAVRLEGAHVASRVVETRPLEMWLAQEKLPIVRCETGRRNTPTLLRWLHQSRLGCQQICCRVTRWFRKRCILSTL